MRPNSAGFLAFGFIIIFLLPIAAGAAEVRVMISGGVSAAYNAVVPEFERVTGDKVLTAYGPSMGTTVNAIPVRLERGEPADVLIMVGYALEDLIKQGKVAAGSRVELAKSLIGVAVKSGAPKPDISSADSLRRALLAAKSIAYSDSASGVYISTEMYCRRHERQGPENPGNARRRNRGPWRRRDRIPADQRIKARPRHRYRRTSSG
jgi:molybdate transport system substrate-binding protein